MSDINKLSVETTYDTDQIDSLEGLEAVRKRPGMYIGSTSQKGVTHLVWEVADNCVDEFVAGFGKEIYINVTKDCTVTISDQGRGIPVGPHHKWKNLDGTPMDTLTGILTKLHAGGKFNKEGSGYKVSAGLHGVGTKAVNALSDKFVATVKRHGKVYRQEFSKGNPTTEVELIGECPENETGTTISYHPDSTIFKLNLDPNCKELQARISELASLNAGLIFYYKNELTGIDKKYVFEDGIVGYTKRMAEGKNLLYDKPFFMRGNYEVDNNRTILVEVSFLHDDESEANTAIKTFANNINTYEGGFHLAGFKKAYQKMINNYGIAKKFLPEPVELKYLLDGIYAVVSVKVPEAEFEGQTKTKLGNAEAQTAVEDVLTQCFEEQLKNDKNEELATILETIVVRAAKVKEAEEAARKARAMKRSANKASRMALPGKLADCENKNGYSELFLVEGDSAAGSAKNGRYREFQAILPLRGKVLNTEKVDFEKMMNSDSVKIIIAALGAGVGKTFDVDKVRYDKINIMTDADDDGSHIKALLLTFFYNYMPELIERGMVYATVPPLYRVTKSGKFFYLKDDHELKEFRKKNSGNITVDRFKGLGEMNPDQLKETTMDPATRILKRITMNDAEKAADVFAICMGTKAELRRDFIEANAYRVELDFV